MQKVSRTQPLKHKKVRKQTGFSFVRIFLIVIILFGCLALAAMAAAAVQVPVMAERAFGPPAAGLSPTQRLIYSYRLLTNRESLLEPFEAAATERSFTIGLGETVNSIANRLEEERLIGNADTLRTYLIYSGLDTGVQAGEYQLSPAMTTVEIAQALQDPVPGAVEFNILPGWRVEELAEALPMSGIEASPIDLVRLVQDPPADLLPAGVEHLNSLEGFLMPGSYVIEREITAYELIRIFIQRFDESVSAEMRAGFANQGLTLEQAVALASIVEREAVAADEQATIASVFYNRLANGMKLDSDPTVQYAVGYDSERGTWWKNPLTSADLRIDSRYNTYIYTGLPPTPIANPGLPAFRAAANPASTGYFFFRALCDGSGRHAFAVNYQEHLNNACP